MDHLEQLESKSIYILREAYANFKNLCMLWSIGKDSTVLLWLARKAFFGHVPLPLVHIDTSYKIPEMIEYRDKLAQEWKLNMIYGQNSEALKDKRTFPDGNVDRITCCSLLKTTALKNTLSGNSPRYRFNHNSGKYEQDKNTEPFTGVIVGFALMKKEAVLRKDIFHHATQKINGELTTSRLNFGTSLKQILRRERILEFILAGLDGIKYLGIYRKRKYPDGFTLF